MFPMTMVASYCARVWPIFCAAFASGCPEGLAAGKTGTERNTELKFMAKKRTKSDASVAPKLHPKLRVFANGDSEVNAVRAEHCSCLAVTTKKLLAEVPERRGEEDLAMTKSALPKSVATPKTLKAAPRDVAAGVFI